MIYSNQRKLSLSGWLKEHEMNEYNKPLKLQKFLLFYEVFSKINGESPDLSYLRGYKRGPVFSQVWGDYTHERKQFDEAASEAYQNHSYEIVSERAERCSFIVKTLSEHELSSLTHKMNLWKSKEQQIMAGKHQVDLEEQDFIEDDFQMISTLEKMYPIEMIRNSFVIEMNNYFFVFSKKDVIHLPEEHFDILGALTDVPGLTNPVYVEVDEEGRLLVDL